MTSPAPAVERDTLGQRLIAAILRGSLKLLVKPVFSAGRPVAEQRRRLESVVRVALIPKGAAFSAGELGGVRGEWVEPRDGSATRLRILYLHGGAYCKGSPRTHRAIAGQLALRARARVFVADYRLAPEHPFPAAVEDAVAAYAALLAGGSAPGEVVIAGDSAGGGLSLATALRAREQRLPQPAALVLFSPWTDLRPRGPGPEPAGEAMLTRAGLDENAAFYLAGRSPDEPQASPLRADLAGLPPTLVQVGTDELLLEDSTALAERLRAQGVEVTIEVYPRRWHVFQANAGVLRDADRALDSAAAFTRARVPG